jgi:hypothetical protein
VSNEIKAGGKIFHEGKSVLYTFSNGAERPCEVIGLSEDSPPGLKLKYKSTVFAISAATVAAKVKEAGSAKANAPEPEPEPLASKNHTSHREPEPEPESDSGSNAGGYSSSSQGDSVGSHSGGSHSGGSNSRGGSSGRGRFRNFFAVLTNDIIYSKRWVFEILFLAVIIVHLVDFLAWGFSSTNSVLYQRAFAYFIVSIIASWAFCTTAGEFFIGIFDFFLIVSLVPVFLLPIIKWGVQILGMSDTASNTIGAVIGFVPWWLLYLIFVRNVSFPSPSKAAAKLFHWLSPSNLSRVYIIGLSIVFVIFLFTTLILPNMTSTTSKLTEGTNTATNPQAATGVFVDFISQTWEKMITGFKDIGKGAKSTYTSWKNATLGQEYSSQVEQNKALTGIFITKLEFESKPYEDTDTIIIGTIKARSFGEMTTIKPQCFAQQTTGEKKRFSAPADPPSIDMYREDQINVICDFGNLPKGSYTFYMELDFNFETGAYVVYPFLDENVSRQMVRDGYNVNTYFGVSEKTKTIYTAGPVKIAMSDEISMPFLLSMYREKGNTLPFGLSVENFPQGGDMGEITKINKVSIKVPRTFDVQKSAVCNHDNGVDLPENQYYKEYTFDVPDYIPKDSKLVIACNAKINNAAASSILSDAAGINAVTLQGVADYEYNLTRRMSGVVAPPLVPVE